MSWESEVNCTDIKQELPEIKTEILDLEETEQESKQNTVSPGPSAQSPVSNLKPELHISTCPDTYASGSGGGSFKLKKNLSASDQILAAVGDRLAQVKNEDKFYLFAKNVASKLRALGNNEQRIYAEKLINDALFEAELGLLSRYSSINTGSGGYLTYSSPGPQSHISGSRVLHIKQEQSSAPCSPSEEGIGIMEDMIIVKTEEAPVHAVQLSSVHADDHINTNHEKQVESFSFVSVKTEIANEFINSEEDGGVDKICAKEFLNQDSCARSVIEAQGFSIEVPHNGGKRPGIALHCNGGKFKKTVRVKKEVDNEYNAFGKFVAQELRSLRSDVNRRLMKRRIQKAVLEVSELDDKKFTG